MQKEIKQLSPAQLDELSTARTSHQLSRAAFDAMENAEAKFTPAQLATMGAEERRFSPQQLAASKRAMRRFAPQQLGDYVSFEGKLTKRQSMALTGAEARDFSAAQFGAMGDGLAKLPDHGEWSFSPADAGFSLTYHLLCSLKTLLRQNFGQ